MKVVSSEGGFAAQNALVELVTQEIGALNSKNRVPTLINLGAGPQMEFETRFAQAGGLFEVDRVDVELSLVEHANVRRQWTGTIEDLSTVADATYDLAFANYVMEHVDDVRSAIREMARILRPGSLAVLTLSNPRSPEFLVAARAPGWLHRVFQPHGFDTRYAYHSISELAECLLDARMILEMIQYSPVVSSYLSRVSATAGWMGDAYDRAVVRMHARALCGAVLVAARKSGSTGPGRKLGHARPTR
jgi:SAM-dependent methyltransferase